MIEELVEKVIEAGARPVLEAIFARSSAEERRALLDAAIAADRVLVDAEAAKTL